MNNETYLRLSYFVAAAIGVLAAVAAVLVLRRRHRDATGGDAPNGLGRLLRRAFPTWLILAVLLGFMSVTYFDCGHKTYPSIVGDRAHLVCKTQEQASAMAYYLAAALVGYGFVVMLGLWARARKAGR